LPSPARPTAARSGSSRLNALKRVVETHHNYTPAALEALSGEMGEIIDALPPGVSPERLILFRRLFREWWAEDLERHYQFFSDASRAVDRLRGEMLDRVSKAAGRLCNALAMLDDQGLAQVGFGRVTRGDLESWRAALTSRISPTALEWLAQFVERKVQLPNPTIEWLAEMAAIGGSFDKGKPRSGWKHHGPGQPRAVLLNSVIFDLAALFQWVTGSSPTRRTHGRDAAAPDRGRPYGPFHTFASAVWPLIFGSPRGLLAAEKRWRSTFRQSGARSEVIANIASRHPEWRLFDENS
jgi:hypothetical protein